MIRYKHTINKREFFKMFLGMHNINQKHEDLKLTDREVDVMVLLMISEYDDPFHGEGRNEILDELDIKASNFSAYLRTLVKKGVIIKKSQRKFELAYPFMGIIRLYNNKYLNPLEITFEFKK